MYIVAYRPVTKWGLCKQRPFLGNGSVNTFPLLGTRLLIMQHTHTPIELCFLFGTCGDVITGRLEALVDLQEAQLRGSSVRDL
jgi:hypothetical protein